MARLGGVVALATSTALAIGCGGGQGHDRTAGRTYDPHAVRYRLRLHNNPVDPAAAFRCYGRCQPETTPQGYLQCLSACPGFEKTPGVRCDSTEVPPETACITVRKQPADKETPPGMVVLGVIAGVAMVVALSSLCASSAQQCGYYQYPPPR